MSFFVCTCELQWFATEGLDDSSEYGQLSWSRCPRLPQRDSPLLLRLLRLIVRRQRRPFAEEKVLHVTRDQILRLLLPRHQAVFVQDHLHPIFPELPRICGDVLVDPLPQFARPRWRVEPRQLLLELHTEHGPGSVSHVERIVPLSIEVR